MCGQEKLGRSERGFSGTAISVCSARVKLERGLRAGDLAQCLLSVWLVLLQAEHICAGGALKIGNGPEGRPCRLVRGRGYGRALPIPRSQSSRAGTLIADGSMSQERV